MILFLILLDQLYPIRLYYNLEIQLPIVSLPQRLNETVIWTPRKRFVHVFSLYMLVKKKEFAITQAAVATSLRKMDLITKFRSLNKPNRLNILWLVLRLFLRTLNGQEVRTNSFGRTILMAGLLSVSWHMNQRDLQVNSLGVSQALGGRDKWRGSLTRAFDLWKQDFDRSLSVNSNEISRTNVHIDRKEDNIAFQSRTVLHHLAHMAMHVDIIDCQIFARAKRLMGRRIGSQDLNSVQRRMKDNWAPTAKARDATWYALRFLCSVLLPEKVVTPNNIHSGYNDPPFDYSARDDALLNRPWVMYSAALIVWCYGYALEGPTTAQIPAAYDFEDQVRDMRAYLRRVGGVHDPEKLKSTRGFNGCSGMLMVLRTVFEKTRWELLREAAVLLDNCIKLLNQPQTG
jgi:hypothetical protein